MNSVTGGFDIGEEFFQCGLVFIADQIGLDDECGVVLHVDEAVWSIKLKSDFLWVHEVENADVVLAVAQMLKRFFERRRVAEEIGKNHDDGALSDFFGNGMQSGNKASFAFWFEIFQGLGNQLQMRGTTAWRDFNVQRIAADGKACCIALVDE